MTAVAGALGSVIGYVGAEVAEPTAFERLLWAPRFYNYATPRTLFLSALTMPMGGPLHKAALETLDAIRENGLYRGARRGHMLGTAFYHNNKADYINRTTSDGDHEIRNGFWVEVLKMIDQGGREQCAYHDRRWGSNESLPKQPPMSRAKQLLFTLSFSDKLTGSDGNVVSVCEDEVTMDTILGVVFSELSTIVFAVIIGTWQRAFWLSGLLVLPLVVKFISLLVAVRRETLVPLPEPHQNPTSTRLLQRSGDIARATSEADAEPTEIYEVLSPSIGFVLLKGQAALILPFFRHYGHPLRETHYDRFREVCGIILIYVFILYFPAGLIALLWMDPNTQYLWLGYQVFAILFMHISRLFGLGGTARTEERIARLLQDGKEVCLQSGNAKVWVSLVVDEVESVAYGRQMVNRIVEDHARTTNRKVDIPYPSK
ncbi:hypothetical protein PtrSN002B_011344 [Pyrenophora tritici-repentis]|uniref:Uncharacterized protein n=2 Tax=Pyrenophora tritici-repentis TaxID=45151 RepID=A0A2W1G023_9PLEO|nr:uncharacterized protein PTRG_02310 [Pyrenophora tritici-repentis Pt-1C-BFP]KAA8623656.1 hypothetical protein PtrV1_04962 [Pyrenophora tritici-repentis]EDU44833.1 predicted protein [Pyrenophora tritici-repentis Pt-1C-BFP]KAF7452668.1 hypothetical protein A1F99_044460 [Pyrenophora tritici-repentis]KAF7574195.1 hypothetical protein PtrM4_058180 [Pyrenophora tritici-repentis]KAI0570560.1 hypothetical protein Alg215_10976 [Pyrenophora tritici-repentis]